MFLGLQQFGVISFEIRTLMYCHTEQRRTQRFISQKSLDTEAPLVRGETEDICEVLLMFFVYFITKQWFARFLKNIYYQSYQQHVHYASVALCAFGTSVILSFMLFTSVFSHSLCDIYM